jgi:hypothetical protein
VNPVIFNDNFKNLGATIASYYAEMAKALMEIDVVDVLKKATYDQLQFAFRANLKPPRNPKSILYNSLPVEGETFIE